MKKNDGRKAFGPWWKVFLAGVVVTTLSGVIGLIAMFQAKPEAVVFVSFRTGSEETFKLTQPETLWLHDTNRGLGSSPGQIEDAAKTVRLYGPDGVQLPFSDDRLGEESGGMGTFSAPRAGSYRLVADSVGRSESRGALKGRRPYSWVRTVCDVSFFYVFPTGLGFLSLGVLMGLWRGICRLFQGSSKEEE